MAVSSEFKQFARIDPVRPEMNRKDRYYTNLYDKSIRLFFWNAFRICTRNPLQAIFFFRAMQRQINAAKIRADYAAQGVNIPPIMILSVTSRCNLHCKGCYHWSLRSDQQEEMGTDKLSQVLGEANELGVSLVVIAGGEPLMRPEVLGIAGKFPGIQFAVFTNGLLIDDNIISTFEHHRNIVPVISLEGSQQQTDDRRGDGIAGRLGITIEKLKKKNIFWGTSLTMTRNNVATVTGDSFITRLNNLGCQLFFFIEYTPISTGTKEWVVTEEQRAELNRKIAECREKYPALFALIPGDEEEFGGCLAGGRGFVHVSSTGNVEPCPFVPYSDSSLKNLSLKAALQSDFLRKIRENSHLLEESLGGCSLWNKKEWLNSALSGKDLKS